MRNTRVDEAQAGMKIARRNINNLRNADNTTVMAESEEQLKSLLKVKEESGKSWLKTQHLKTKDHGIWSHHFMANGKAMETVTDFIFLRSKITVDSECSHEIRRHMLFGRKSMTNLDSVLKSRDTTLPTKVCIVQLWFS